MRLLGSLGRTDVFVDRKFDRRATSGIIRRSRLVFDGIYWLFVLFVAHVIQQKRQTDLFFLYFFYVFVFDCFVLAGIINRRYN